MARYSYSKYGTGTYGESSRLTNTVMPMSAILSDYTTVVISWNSIDTTVFKNFRLVRSQDGFSETQEDGVYLLNTSNFTTTFTDSPSSSPVPIIPGRFAYYTLWGQPAAAGVPTGEWTVLGETLALIPNPHPTKNFDGVTFQNTHDKFMEMLPKAFTTTSGGALDAVDKASDLYNFLSPFSVLMDEAMTYSELLTPNFNGVSIDPNLLELQSKELGVEFEPSLSSKIQGRRVRDAIRVYSLKGTKRGVEAFSEDLTNFSPNATVSPNVFLDMQNSSFYKGLGNWIPVGPCALTLENTVPAATGVSANSSGLDIQDKSYTGKCVISGTTSYLVNGADSPITKGIPVNRGVTYNFSFYAKSSSGNSVVLTPYITWYDYTGTKIGSEVSGATTTLSSTNWTKSSSFTATAPGRFSNATAVTISGNTVTLAVPSGHSFSTGNTVLLSGFSYLQGVSILGTQTLTATTSTSVSFAATKTVSAPITAVSAASGSVTYTTSSAHQLNVGQVVSITGITSPSGYNVTNATITDVTDTTFKVTNATTGTAVIGSTTITASLGDIASTAFTGLVEMNETKAVYASVRIAFSKADTLYLDMMQFGDNSDSRISNYSEARAVDVALAPSKINFIFNPSFEIYASSSFTNWTATRTVAQSASTCTAAFSNPTNLPSPKMANVTTTSTATTLASPMIKQNIAASGFSTDTPYTFSIYMKVSADANSKITFAVTPKDGTNTYESTTYTPSSVTASSGWQRYYVTAYVPGVATIAGGSTTATVDATTLNFDVSIYENVGSAITISLDLAQFELTSTPTDYFDGYLPAVTGALWKNSSSVASSHSYLYPNLITKINRLQLMLPDYIAYNTPYTISTYSGVISGGVA